MIPVMAIHDQLEKLNKNIEKLAGILEKHYAEADRVSIFDFCRTIMRSVNRDDPQNTKGEKIMKENLTPGQKKAMIANLEKAVCIEETGISISYFEELDIVKIQPPKGDPACFSLEGKNALAVLHKTLHGLMSHVNKAYSDMRWREEFGPLDEGKGKG